MGASIDFRRGVALAFALDAPSGEFVPGSRRWSEPSSTATV